MPAEEIDHDAYDAIADLYHRYLTGLVLALVADRGEQAAADALFGLFRRQHLEKFLPGLRKLGLEGEPDAVACAKYHYLSNHLGGVSVVFVPEHDHKAWVRYLPPRWIFDGTALAAISSRVARSMLHAWHGHNGVSLGNPRLGFVCTGQTMDGAPGLEGYYIEEERELAPDERVRFRFGERCPDVDPAALPTVDASTWPPERLAKVSRNYSMDYVRNMIPVLTEQFGPLEASGLAYRTGRRIGMQYGAQVCARLGHTVGAGAGAGPAGAAELLARLLRAHGDEVAVEIDEGQPIVLQRSWRLMRGLEAEAVPGWFDAWRGLWEGILAMIDRDLRVQMVGRLDCGDGAFGWQLRPTGAPAGF